MSTIDMTQVAGLQAVNEEGQVIGTLSVDDLTELVATKIVQEAKNEAVSARSASVMSEASTLAATDEYEDQLELDTNPAYVRSLDSEGNPKRTATTSLASVVGGLIGTATTKKNGLISSTLYSELKLSFYSGNGFGGGSDKMYNAFSFANNTIFSAFITSATIDKTPAMYAITGRAFTDTVEIKIININGVSEGEKTRYFYKENTYGNFDFYIYLTRSDKYVIFSQICYGIGYVGISGEEVDINTDDKTEIQTT